MAQRPLRLLMFNLMTDVNDPVLSFATEWIRELAKHCEYIDLITMYHGEAELPDNVRVFSAGREHGLSKPGRVVNFYRHLISLLMTRQYDACFAHMMPLFAGLAGPLLTLRGIPTVLWYTHRQKSTQLKLGLKMSWRVVSAVPTSFPYETSKLRVIGHGIDTTFFAPTISQQQAGTTASQAIVVQVARLAEIKHQATTIQAIAQTSASLTFIGGVQEGYPTEYKRELEGLAEQLNITDRVHFVGDLPPTEVRNWYQRSAIAVNMSPVGLFDKATLESMACGVPTIVSNSEFADLMGDYRDLLLVDHPKDVEGLQNRIHQLLSLSQKERAQIGLTLRENVVKRYSLSGLVERLVAVLRSGELTATV